MSYLKQFPLPSKKEVKTKLPLSDNLKKKIEQDRQEICDILSGKDDRKILILGPCSAWPSEAVIDYAEKLAPLSKKFRDKLKIVMRTYIQKPRTTMGWQGPIVQPNPFGEVDMSKGIFYCREMMLKVLKTGLPIADEMLFPRKESYFRDLLSWAAIGARSSENSEHRILASMLDFPIGVKNPTSGSIKIGVNSVSVSQQSNYLALENYQVQTSGNKFAHLVLRGGNNQSNISEEKLKKVVKYFAKKEVQNPSFIVDASHENSIDKSGQNNPLRQPEVIWETLDISRKNTDVDNLLKGWMMESFIEDGSQDCLKVKSRENLKYGKSITDGCLGWKRTEKFIQELFDKL